MLVPTKMLRSAAAGRLRQPSREAGRRRRRPWRWWFSTSPSSTHNSAGRSSSSNGGGHKLPLVLVSRRALLQQKQQQQHPSSKSSPSGGGGAKQRAHGRTHQAKKSAEEKPWPRSVVMGFYAAGSVLVPYSFAWFLASQESWRTALLGDDDGGDVVEEEQSEPTTATLQQRILQWMRRHFGEIDSAALSEPERLELEHRQWNNSGGPAAGGMIVPHKFLDEPTAAVRRQQARVARQNRQTNLPVRLWHRGPPWEGGGATTTTLAELPAATPATPEAVRRALGLPERALVALDFPVGKESHLEMQEEEEEGKATVFLSDGKENEDGITPESNPSMSIYSLWHHHSAPRADNNAAASDSSSASSSSSHSRMSPAQLELSRLDHEIAQLKQELASGSRSHRAIDDIRHDLQQKQSERRRWQLKRWLGR